MEKCRIRIKYCLFCEFFQKTSFLKKSTEILSNLSFELRASLVCHLIQPVGLLEVIRLIRLMGAVMKRLSAATAAKRHW